MSKLSKLKQEAYLAGKRRDWDSAISIYQRILEVEKNNPTLVNELGDICLRMGNMDEAVEHFLAAAASYRNTGLSNNAVAIYKKILRHETENLNAHWFLSEIRAGQSLIGDGEEHARTFLAVGCKIPTELKDLYLKRCVKLLSLYATSRAVSESLASVFRFWTMPLEEARAAALVACVDFETDQQAEAREAIASLLEEQPDVANYPEYSRWKQLSGETVSTAEYSDVNTLDLGAPPGKDPVSGEQVSEQPLRPGTIPRAEASSSPAASDADDDSEVGPRSHDETEAAQSGSLDELAPAMPEDGPATPGDTPDPDSERNGEGRIDIDLDETASFADILDDAESPQEAEGASGSVDLLAEILSEGDLDVDADGSRQMNTIASEICTQVGGDDDDADAGRQQEMGMVYLEMGMFEQAAECFAVASGDPEYTMRALEMWGITLLRLERADEAIDVLKRGIPSEETPSVEQLGIRYHLGLACEQAGRVAEARTEYEEVHRLSPTFLDVEKRLMGMNKDLKTDQPAPTELSRDII